MFPQDWDEVLNSETRKSYYIKLMDFIEREYGAYTVYPPKEQIFFALSCTAYKETRVVILGQDPYHQPGQAHGLSFSVNPGITPPPSLRNIFKELENDLNITPPSHGCLTAWAKQGTLLLNSALTVRCGQANSHRNIGWEIFTDAIIQSLNQKATPIVFLLWGKTAQKKADYITEKRHLVLKSAHPSPLARGAFFGQDHFSQTNAFLKENYGTGIQWTLPEL